MKFRVPFLLLIAICSFATAQKASQGSGRPPQWAKHAIWYQIFVERFNNGDAANDPKPENINMPPVGMIAPEGWAVTPWTQEWYRRSEWESKAGKSFGEMVQYRRYGGDLQGVLDKLDYMQDLGINAIYLNPVNDAPSLHKYDARNYHHIDVNFGPDPEGDLKIMAGEKPDDPKTWKWTSADRLFLKLIDECHKRHIRIIMDYSWNHTGVMFWAWQDILKNQEKSRYKDWYAIKSFDNPATLQNEFTYDGWAGVASLPELRKVNITTTRINGYPYEGDINPGAKRHIFNVTRRWLAPDGDTAKGVDGFRLDVADQIGLVFWRDYRKFVRKLKPDAYLVGEIWWAKWPDKLMDPAPYVGDVFDAVMFYHGYRPARYFFARTAISYDAKQFMDSLLFELSRIPKDHRSALMNVSSTHDAPRLLTDFYNPNNYKYKATPNDDSLYKTGKPDAETYRRLKLYLVHLFTTLGAPQLWNGEEMGMWGADDPHCRKPLWWKGMAFEPETRTNFRNVAKSYDETGFNQEQFDLYKQLISIRMENPVLATGNLEVIEMSGKKLSYRRYDDKTVICVLFNLGESRQMFDLKEDGPYDNLFGERSTKTRYFMLEPYSAAILKKSK